MIKRKKKKEKKIILILVGIIFSLAIIYAAYVSMGYQKAVIATAQKVIPFSSNYLLQIDQRENITYSQVIPSLKYENDKAIFTITVNNYSITGNSATAEGVITYAAQFKFKGEKQGCIITNKGNDSIPNESGIVTYNDTLPLGRNTNTYTVSVPVENLGKVTVEVSVKPDSDSLEWTDNKMLAAEITPVKVSEKIGFECKSGFSDSELNNKQPYDYSAFRYYIEINSGQAQITLKWNDKYVKPDNAFLESLGDGVQIQTDGDYKFVVFTMDYADEPTINTIFYRKKGRNSNEDWQKTWDNMKNVVVVYAKEIKNN